MDLQNQLMRTLLIQSKLNFSNLELPIESAQEPKLTIITDIGITPLLDFVSAML